MADATDVVLALDSSAAAATVVARFATSLLPFESVSEIEINSLLASVRV
jgi:hypothetical protein